MPDDTALVGTWLREGEARFLSQVNGLNDDELAEPSALPDWSRKHVIAHVARNAESLCRLLFWARTGEERLMYPDGDSRNRDIETTALNQPDVLRADARETSAALAADIEELPEDSWSARVRTFQGRDIPATFVLWMRVREVWLHLVDLGSGVLVESWPGDLVDALLDEVTATMSGREDAPALRLAATDRERSWQIGVQSGDEQEAQELSGKAADILAWLTGRSTGQGLATDGILPTPPHWM